MASGGARERQGRRTGGGKGCLISYTPTARDFVGDAFAHCKCSGYVKTALPLFRKAGVSDSRDGGCIALKGPEGCVLFIAMCRQLRFWAREAVVQHMTRQDA